MNSASMATKETVSTFSLEDLCDYLTDQRLHEEVITTIRENRITGKHFVELTDELLREMFPCVGARMALSRLIGSLAGTETLQHCQKTTRSPSVSYSKEV